jgi:transcriptional regulator with XRE-family HTH domain
MNTPTQQEYKELRKKRGTQQQVADMLGIDRITIVRRERLPRPITTEAWLAMNALPEKVLKSAKG